jgi:GNAT superfamily N-acetyltransferase
MRHCTAKCKVSLTLGCLMECWYKTIDLLLVLLSLFSYSIIRVVRLDFSGIFLSIILLLHLTMSSSPLTFSIRPAVRSDCSIIHKFIQDLAVFEQALEEVRNTPEQLAADGFDAPQPRWFGFIVDTTNRSPNVPIGHAICYFAYSTWKGNCLYLDDLYIDPAYRSQGVGLELLHHVVDYAWANQCKRVMWQALDWNEGALKFYDEKVGAIVMKEWLNLRLTEDGMKQFLTRRAEEKEKKKLANNNQ